MQRDGLRLFLVITIFLHSAFKSLALVRWTHIRHTKFGSRSGNRGLRSSLAESSPELDAQKHEGIGVTRIHENVSGFFQQRSEVPDGIITGNTQLGELRDAGCRNLLSIKDSKNGFPAGKMEAWRHANLRTVFPSATYNFNDAFNDERRVDNSRNRTASVMDK